MNKTLNKALKTLPVTVETFKTLYYLIESENPYACKLQKKRMLCSELNIHHSTYLRMYKMMLTILEPDSEPSPVNEENIGGNMNTTLVETTDENIDEMFCHAKSTLYGKDGDVKLVWEKTKLNEQLWYEHMKLAIKNMMKGFDDKYVPKDLIKSDLFIDKDLCTFYPLVDLHLGMLVDEDISDEGRNWNLHIAEKYISKAMEQLVNNAPHSGTAIITDLGDYLHTSDDKNRSQSGHVLNASSMHYRTIQVALELAKTLIELALTKHETVHFYTVKGNHSENVGIYLQAYLSAWFKNEPRVIISEGHQAHKYFQFGETLLGFTHHISGTQNASEIMMFDNQELISFTKYRYYHMGHVHHNKLEQGRLVTVECHQNLPVRDAWASSMGFRGTLGQAKAITYHNKYGEVSRQMFNIQMLEDMEKEHV